MNRHKDLVVTKIMLDPQNHIVELYGAELDGSEAWVMLHMPEMPDINGPGGHGDGTMDKIDWGHFVTSGMSWAEYLVEQDATDLYEDDH